MILLINIGFSLSTSKTIQLQSNNRILFIYTTEQDKLMGFDLISELGILYDSLNSSNTIEFNDTDFDSYKSIWIFHSKAETMAKIKLTKKWFQNTGRGLLVLSNYPETFDPDLQKLIGIEQTYPFHFPLNTSTSDIIKLIPQKNSILNLRNQSFEYYGKSAIVQMSEKMQTLALASLPIINHSRIIQNSTSPFAGIFASQTERIIYSTLSSYQSNSTSIENQYNIGGNLLGIKSIFILHFQQSVILPQFLIDFFTIFTEFSITGQPPEISRNNELIPNLSIDTSQIGPLLGIIALLVGLIVVLTSRGRSFIFGLFAGLIGVLAHIAYTPVRRRLTRTDLLENNTRSRILIFIETRGTQGAHLRQIQRNVGCGVSTLLWHLQTLEDFQLVDSMKVGRYTLFFSSDVQIEDDDLSAMLRTEMAKKIFTFLIKSKKPQTLASIAKKVSCHPETARYHLKKLVQNEAVIKNKDGKKILYLVPPKIKKKWKLKL